MRLLPGSRNRQLLRAAVVAVAGVLLASAVSGCTGDDRSSAARRSGTLIAGPASCRWTDAAPRPGSQTFAVHNRDYGPVRVVLTQPSTGAIWGDTGALAAGDSISVRVA